MEGVAEATGDAEQIALGEHRRHESAALYHEGGACEGGWGWGETRQQRV